MKFGKLIQALIDAALPAWKDKFLPYKRLKKRLNSLIGEVLANSIRAAGAGPYGHGLPYAVGEVGIGYPAAYGAAATMDLYGNDGAHARNGLEGSTTHAMASESQPGGKRGRGPYEEGRGAKRQCLLDESEFKRLLEMEFKRLLEGELDKLNDFVVEKEEEFVIKSQHFKEKVERLKDMMKGNDKNQLDVINLQKDVTVFHGEMVLLENYSSLNYIGLVKIVKKHDRLTGAWLRLSFIPDVLRQPFYSTDILSRLVKDCESNLLSVFPSYSGETADRASFERDTQESIFEDDSLFCEDVIKEIYKNTMAALQTIRNMGKGSSTYNVYSVPPCEDNDDAGSVVDEE